MTSSGDGKDTCDGKVEACEVAMEVWEAVMSSEEPSDDGGEVHSGEEMTAKKRFLSNSEKTIFFFLKEKLLPLHATFMWRREESIWLFPPTFHPLLHL